MVITNNTTAQCSHESRPGDSVLSFYFILYHSVLSCTVYANTGIVIATLHINFNNIIRYYHLLQYYLIYYVVVTEIRVRIIFTCLIRFKRNVLYVTRA